MRNIKKKIVILGASLVSGNRGVNALTRGTINLLLDKFDINVEITILSFTTNKVLKHQFKHNGKNIDVLEVPCGLKKQIILFNKIFLFRNRVFNFIFPTIINKNYKYIKESDYILDLSEGDSFSDIYGVKRFILHSFLKLQIIFMGKNLIFLPQTIGPFNNKLIKNIASYVMNKSKYCFVRDKISYNIAKEDLKVDCNKLLLSPDMAFYMEPKEINIEIDFNSIKKENILVGINVSALLYNGGYTGNNMFGLKEDYKKLINGIIEYFMNLSNVKVILIPHVITSLNAIEDDMSVCNNLQEYFNNKYKNRILSFHKEYREDEIKYIISQCDFFIGGRMHSCIGAISSKVPTVPTAYSRKFLGIWEQMDMGNSVIDLRKCTLEEAIKILNDNFNNKIKIKDILECKIPLIKEKIESMLDFLI